MIVRIFFRIATLILNLGVHLSANYRWWPNLPLAKAKIISQIFVSL